MDGASGLATGMVSAIFGAASLLQFLQDENGQSIQDENGVPIEVD